MREKNKRSDFDSQMYSKSSRSKKSVSSSISDVLETKNSLKDLNRQVQTPQAAATIILKKKENQLKSSGSRNDQSKQQLQQSAQTNDIQIKPSGNHSLDTSKVSFNTNITEYKSNISQVRNDSNGSQKSG